MRVFIVILVVNLLLPTLQAQDAQFSQYFNSIQTINPACTGMFSGSDKVVLQFRDQWSSIVDGGGYKTYQATYEHRYEIDLAAINFSLYTTKDKVGGDLFSQSTGGITMSYLRRLSGNKFSRREASQYLSAGVNVGFGQFKLDANNLWFGNQYDIINTHVDFDIDPRELDIANTSLSSNLYPDVGVGLMWYLVWGNQSSFYISTSLQHANQANISLLEEGAELMSRKYSFHIGGEYYLSRQWSILPSNLFLKQSKSYQNIVGTQIRYADKEWENSAMQLGAFMRWTNSYDQVTLESIIISLNIEWSTFRLGLGYDLTCTNLNVINRNRGAFGLSLTYLRRHAKKTNSLSNPNF